MIMMRNKKSSGRLAGGWLIAAWLSALGWILLSAGEALIFGQQGKKPEAVRQIESTSFIKKELLPKLNPSMAQAKRDLFRPSSSEIPAFSDSKIHISEENVGGEIQNASILESLYITCPGLIDSGNKKVALIEVEGQALSLIEGEELILGIRLVKITTEEILFQDDQGNSRKVRVKEN